MLGNPDTCYSAQMAYLAQLSYTAETTAGAFYSTATFDAQPALLTDYDNWAESASHFVNAYVAENGAEHVVSCAFDAEARTVTIHLTNGNHETYLIKPSTGRLLAVTDGA